MLSTIVLTVIDPEPRNDVRDIADKVMKGPFETISNSEVLTSMLDENDILFIDSSHGCYINSDVTKIYLNILPILKKGVVVHIHDIFLPFDYPYHFVPRNYNEQYLLAMILLFGDSYEILMPNAFVTLDKVFQEKYCSFLSEEFPLNGFEKHGNSFWMIKK